MNEILKIKEEQIDLPQPNTLSKEELLKHIKQNNLHENQEYSLLYLLKYNIDLSPHHINTFLRTKHTSDSYLSSIQNIDTISWKPSIYMFHPVNSLFIIFQKKVPPHSNQKTKKVYIHSLLKNKTISKRYKNNES